MIKRLRHLKYLKYFFSYMKDSTYPLLEKVFIIVGIIYLISPIDLIPDLFIPIGFIDDLIVLIILAYFLIKILKTYSERMLASSAHVHTDVVNNKSMSVEYDEVKEEEVGK